MTALLNPPFLAFQRPGAEPCHTVALTTTIRVTQDRLWVGNILLGADDRVLRTGPDIPRDVILKALLAFTRHDELSGRLRGRDGRGYSWQVVGMDEL